MACCRSWMAGCMSADILMQATGCCDIVAECFEKAPWINLMHVNQCLLSTEYVKRRVCIVNVQSSCMKMLSFLFVQAWAIPRTSYLSCGVPFPFWTPDNISGLISVVLWLLRWEVIKKISGNILLSGGGANYFSPSPLPLKSYLKFFGWLLTLTATQQLMSNQIRYQVSKSEMEFHMI